MKMEMADYIAEWASSLLDNSIIIHWFSLLFYYRFTIRIFLCCEWFIL